MKPHPRIRKTIKWGGAAVSVLLVVVWIGTQHRAIGWQIRSMGSVWLGGGRFTIDTGFWASIPETSGPIAFAWGGPPGWRFESVRDGPCWALCAPLWMLTAVSLSIAAISLRLDTLARRRERMGKCPKCNYDRAGIAGDAKCPECGSGGGAAP
jgi:hypothetical protein